jgi:hypothetical protein
MDALTFLAYRPVLDLRHAAPYARPVLALGAEVSV